MLRRKFWHTRDTPRCAKEKHHLKPIVPGGVLAEAEDMGLEPTTGKPATDFESVCLPIRLSSGSEIHYVLWLASDRQVADSDNRS